MRDFNGVRNQILSSEYLNKIMNNNYLRMKILTS